MCVTLMLFSVIVTLLRFVFVIIGYKPTLSDVAFHYTTRVIISTFCSNTDFKLKLVGILALTSQCNDKIHAIP